MKLNSIALALLASLSITQHNSIHSMELSCKNVALAACATIAGVAVSKMAYDYFSALTDAQEFEQAMKLCEESEELINTVMATYGCHFTSTNWHEIPHITYHQFNPILNTPSVRYPLYSYVNRLEAVINQLIDREDTLAKTKAHIFERCAQLSTALASANHQERIAIQSSIEAYDFLLEELQKTLFDLKLKRKFLQSIKHAAVAHPQYVFEKQQLRIEELERKLIDSYLYSHQPIAPLWRPHPVHHVYIHTTVYPKNCPSNINNDACSSAITCSTPEQPCPCPMQHTEKKLEPTHANAIEHNNELRDTLCTVGDNFNG